MQNVRYFYFDTKSGQCVHIWTIVRVLNFVQKAFTMAAHVTYVLKFGCMSWVHRWLKFTSCNHIPYAERGEFCLGVQLTHAVHKSYNV